MFSVRIFFNTASSGTVFPCSHADTVFTDTPSAAANFTCDSPNSLRFVRIYSGKSVSGASSKSGIGSSGNVSPRETFSFASPPTMIGVTCVTAVRSAG